MVNLDIQLPEGFLDEEVRCDYTVTRQMKEVWAVELDLAKKLLDVCEKYNIKIMTFAGTTLGAIRHKGFIPWDDDIDFIVERNDYEKLCSIAIDEFKEPYFFQTEYTDPGTIRGHAQLRNSRTTGILNNGEIYLEFNQGIFIDIFPIDNIPDNPKEFTMLKKRAQKYRNLYTKIAGCSKRYSQYTSSVFAKRIAKGIAHVVMQRMNRDNRLEEYFYKKFEKLMSSYDGVETENCGTITFMPDEKRFYFSTESIVETVKVPFEFLEFPVPIGYEEQLKNAYGDYHQYVIGGSVHGSTLFDTNHSYIHYLKKRGE